MYDVLFSLPRRSNGANEQTVLLSDAARRQSEFPPIKSAFLFTVALMSAERVTCLVYLRFVFNSKPNHGLYSNATFRAPHYFVRLEKRSAFSPVARAGGEIARREAERADYSTSSLIVLVDMAKFLRRSFRRKKDHEQDELEMHAVRYKPEGIDALCKNTKFSRKEIQLMYRGFKQECPSGMVNEDTFKGIYAQFFPQGDASRYAHYVFMTFDPDQNGSISFQDFVVGLSVLSRGSLQDKLRWAFNLYDINHDGSITRDEMLDIVTSIYSLLGRYTDPVVEENTTQDHVERVFQRLDLNRDGVITIDEFMEMCMKDETIAKSMSLLDTVL